MTAEKKISAGQLMLLLLLARVMHTMMFRADGFESGLPMMLGLLCSTAVEAVAALPAVIYFEKGGADIPRELFGKNSAVFSLLYTVYFTVIAGGTVALFAEFMQQEFSKTVSPTAATVLLLIAAAYCASLGIEGLGRAGTAVFWLFAIMSVLMVTVSEGSFDWLNLRPLAQGDGETFSRYFVESLSSSWWLPMFCVLGANLKSGAKKAVGGYLVLKLVIIETLLLLVTLVLWRYIDVLGYPILALGAYAKSDFIQRFDAINMFVWAINCALAVGVYIFISAKPFSRKRFSCAIPAALAGVFALFEYKRGLRFDEPWLLGFKLGGIILLGVLAPLCACIKMKVKEYISKGAEE